MTNNIYTKVMIDIVICLDCTNGKALVNVIEPHIIRMVDSFNTMQVLRERLWPGDICECVVYDCRVRVIGYGDCDIGEIVQNNTEFVCIADLRDQIDSLNAYAGGDEPESTLDAIWYAAKTSDWRNNCMKVIMVFTDAPTKSVNNKTLEDIPSSYDDLYILAQELKVEHIKLFLWGQNDSIYKAMERIPRADVHQFEDGIMYYKSNVFEESIQSAFSLIRNTIPVYY